MTNNVTNEQKSDAVIYGNGEIELERSSTIKKFLIVQKEGERKIARDVEHYSLDMVISVGYKVSSIKDTKFCQWETNLNNKLRRVA